MIARRDDRPVLSEPMDDEAVGPDDRCTVAICCLTFRRPVGLRRALEGIATLSFPAGSEPRQVRVVIIDNDPDESGRKVVDDMRANVPFEIHYAVERARGIPYGRNRAVAESGDVDFVAFIDDDESPEPSWLAELLRVASATGADVVTGPVIPIFEEEPPGWVVQGGFFERRRYPTGAMLHYARTSNVLIEKTWFARWSPPFETGFGLSGGDDTFFFERLHRAGGRIVWADEALVKEWVPSSRTGGRWIIKRGFRVGATLSKTLVLLDPPFSRRAKRVAHGLVRIVAGVATTVAGIIRGRDQMVRGARDVAYGWGLIAGIWGGQLDEYRQIHGR